MVYASKIEESWSMSNEVAWFRDGDPEDLGAASVDEDTPNRLLQNRHLAGLPLDLEVGSAAALAVVEDSAEDSVVTEEATATVEALVDEAASAIKAEVALAEDKEGIKAVPRHRTRLVGPVAVGADMVEVTTTDETATEAAETLAVELEATKIRWAGETVVTTTGIVSATATETETARETAIANVTDTAEAGERTTMAHGSATTTTMATTTQDSGEGIDIPST